MMIILPVFSWIFFVLLLVRKGVEWRAAFLVTAVLWGCLVTVFTEFLSFFELLTMGGLALCWGITVAVALWLNFRLKKPWKFGGKYAFSPLESGVLGGVTLIIFTTFVTAVLAPPNTWDSMTYHMSRVMHWLQNRSVAHYSTHILRQLELNPWAEFAISHFQALSGGDRYANLVQWFSMTGSLVGVSLIARQLGGDRRAQLFSTVVAVTIPMGILQATSTQNDYVVAFWLICLVWSSVEFIQNKKPQWALLVGACLGLAVLAKGTAYLFAFPFMVWFVYSTFCTAPRRMVIIFCFLVPFVLLNGGHYQRNLKLFSSPLTSGEHRFSNEPVSTAGLVSNLLRNTALQFSSPFDSLNHLIVQGVAGLHEGMNIDLNDAGTTWPDERFWVGKLTRQEDTTGNFLHAVLILAVLLTLPLSRGVVKGKTLILCYVVAVLTGYILFCLILKWQPWHSRLLLPLFVLGAPAIAIIVWKCWKPCFLMIISLMLLIAALPWAFSNDTRPLVKTYREGGGHFPLITLDRNFFYFVGRGDLYMRYVKAAEEIQKSGAANIGIVCASGDAWEYPLWVLIKNGNNTPVRIEHINVGNVSQSIGNANFKPDIWLEIN